MVSSCVSNVFPKEQYSNLFCHNILSTFGFDSLPVRYSDLSISLDDQSDILAISLLRSYLTFHMIISYFHVCTLSANAMFYSCSVGFCLKRK